MNSERCREIQIASVVTKNSAPVWATKTSFSAPPNFGYGIGTTSVGWDKIVTPA